MLDDFIHGPDRLTVGQATQKLLQSLERLLQRDHGRSLANYGLPVPADVSTEVGEESQRYTAQEQQQVCPRCLFVILFVLSNI